MLPYATARAWMTPGRSAMGKGSCSGRVFPKPGPSPRHCQSLSAPRERLDAPPIPQQRLGASQCIHLNIHLQEELSRTCSQLFSG